MDVSIHHLVEYKNKLWTRVGVISLDVISSAIYMVSDIISLNFLTKTCQKPPISAICRYFISYLESSLVIICIYINKLLEMEGHDLFF